MVLWFVFQFINFGLQLALSGVKVFSRKDVLGIRSKIRSCCCCCTDREDYNESDGGDDNHGVDNDVLFTLILCQLCLPYFG